MSLDVEKGAELLNSDGPLSHCIPGYESREQQQKMLQNIIDAYNHDKIALIEAGTGTGKSMGYLIPAILWSVERKERSLISTNTISLQEQLIFKDIPLAIKSLKMNVKAVLVKGMRNYICLRKLEDAKYEKGALPDKEAEELDHIEQWAEKTRDGTLSDLSFNPSFQTWERVSAESDTCNRRECPHYQACPFFKARKEAEDAQILVTNHSMLFADLAYRSQDSDAKEQGLIPDYHRVVLDEAHNIEETATEFFADKVSHLHTFRTLRRLGGSKTGKLTLLEKKIYEYHRKERPLEVKNLLSRLDTDLSAQEINLEHQITDTFQIFTDFIEELHATDGKGENKMRIFPRHLLHPRWKKEVLPHTSKLIELISKFTQSIRQFEGDILSLKNVKLTEATEGLRFEINALATRLDEVALTIKEFTSEKYPDTHVRWIELQHMKSMTNLFLINAQLDIAPLLARSLFGKFPTTVLCSATLATNKTFKFIRNRIGITEELLPEKIVTENIYQSPFDFQKQALLAVPSDMPNPNHPDFVDEVCKRIWDAITASRGNAFILFTSYSMLRTCYEKMHQAMRKNRFHPFKQGDASRQVLLENFRKTEYSVLFATDSFWEGVDVAGDALRCVVIVKLPFRVPSEPIIQARTEKIVSEGRDPFFEYSVPNAVVKFKQGFGRLIRNKKDRGCILCLDSRLVTKGYGRLFLNSLPPTQQLIGPGNTLKNAMIDFYKKTYYLVAKK